MSGAIGSARNLLSGIGSLIVGKDEDRGLASADVLAVGNALNGIFNSIDNATALQVSTGTLAI